MNMFSNMTTDGLESSGDYLGGGGTLETDAYEGVVKLAYVGKSQSSSAQSVTALIDINGREFRETFWVTNKSNENFYLDKKDPKKKHPLPGFTSVDDLCLLTTGFPLAQQEIAEKIVNIYDFEARKEIPQAVSVLIDLIGKPIRVAVIKQIVDKQQKDPAGNYVPTGETREENISDKFFHAESKRTVTEIREGLEEGIFLDKWVEKNAGKTRNRAKGANGNAGTTGRPGAPAAAAKTAPKTSLFS